MAANPYDCAYCGALFARASEHMSHVTRTHDIGFIPRGQRTYMSHLRCWRCASDMPRDENNKYACLSCGFVLPDKHVLRESASRDEKEYSADQHDEGDTDEGDEHDHRGPCGTVPDGLRT